MGLDQTLIIELYKSKINHVELSITWAWTKKNIGKMDGANWAPWPIPIRWASPTPHRRCPRSRSHWGPHGNPPDLASGTVGWGMANGQDSSSGSQQSLKLLWSLNWSNSIQFRRFAFQAICSCSMRSFIDSMRLVIVAKQCIKGYDNFWSANE